jgi:hypothetical protein
MVLGVDPLVSMVGVMGVWDDTLVPHTKKKGFPIYVDHIPVSQTAPLVVFL